MAMNLLPKIFMDGVVINSIKSAFSLYWKRWSVFLLGGQFITFLELAFIGCAYLLLSKEQISAFSRRLLTLGVDYPTLRFSTDVFVRHPELVTLLIALIILGALTYVRYALLVKSQVLRYELEMIDSRTLVSSFLMSSPSAAQKYGKERIISSITQDAGAPGTCVKYSLDALTAFFSMIIYLSVAVTTSWQICALALGLYILPVWFTHRIYGRMIGIGETKKPHT